MTAPVKDVPTAQASAERALVCLLLRKGSLVYAVIDAGLRDHSAFATKRCALLYWAMLKVAETNATLDPIVVAHQLAQHPDAKVHGVTADDLQAWLEDMDEPATEENVLRYAKIVRDASQLRLVADACRQGLKQATEGGGDPQAIIASIGQRIMDAAQPVENSGLVHISVALNKLFEELDNPPPNTTGLTTGLLDLDEMIGGLKAGRLYVVGGRPGAGKSSLGLFFAISLSTMHKVPCAVFSMEMRASEITDRACAMIAGIDSRLIESRRMGIEERYAMEDARKMIARAPLYIRDASSQSFIDIRSQIQSFKMRHGRIGLVVVDYVGLLDEVGKPETRQAHIASVTRGLKKVAGDFECPVVLLAQLNRDLEKREEKRPHLSDFRESGSLEQDADVVIFTYRHCMYEPNTRFPNVMEAIVSKQRGGKCGTIPLSYMAEYTRVNSLESGVVHDYLAWLKDGDRPQKRGRNYEPPRD